MIKLTKINKNIFSPYYKDSIYLKYGIFKKYCYFLFKLIILLYFFIFIISQYKLKNQKILSNFNNNKIKKKI